MPNLNGLELARRVQEIGIPVVLMSAVASGAGGPGVGFVAKPFDLDEILDVVNTISIQKKPRSDPAQRAATHPASVGSLRSSARASAVAGARVSPSIACPLAIARLGKPREQPNNWQAIRRHRPKSAADLRHLGINRPVF